MILEFGAENSFKVGYLSTAFVIMPLVDAFVQSDLKVRHDPKDCFLLQIFFIESLCDDPNVIATNIMVCFVINSQSEVKSISGLSEGYLLLKEILIRFSESD